MMRAGPVTNRNRQECGDLTLSVILPWPIECTSVRSTSRQKKTL